MPNSNVVKLYQENPDDNFVALAARIKEHTARITVVGQGYVGLPLAIEFAKAGYTVIGLDIDQDRVNALNSNRSSTPDVSDEDIKTLVNSGKYKASTDFSHQTSSDVILICVPTPLRKSKDPDISYILGSAEKVLENLHPGQLIILESTTYPGTTEELLLPLFESKGLQVGKDFFLAFSPERIDPGNVRYRVRDIPKVTGGITPHCTKLAALFYRQIVSRVVEVSNPRVAELVKLYENVFRSVNIALANEFSLMCRQLNVSSREVIDAAASKPFGFMPFYPGPGIGGHCIPIDPAYLVWKMKFSNYQARFIPLAEEINQSMPAHVINLIAEALNQRQQCLNGARILALGVAYKRGVSDVRESPAVQIIGNLMDKGVCIEYADPFVESIEIRGRTLLSTPLTDASIAATDCVLILTDHVQFDYRQIVANAPLIVDTRGATWGIDSRENQIVSI